MLEALLRPPDASLARCELTWLAREPIDVERARRQHAAYAEALRGAGCETVRLPGAPGHPDAVFVEDTVLVLPELALALRPGAASRRGEVESVARAVAARRELLPLSDEEPGTVDGGDLVVDGRTVLAGLSTRTNQLGLEALARRLARHGYEVRAVPVSGCLHLKTAATLLGPGVFLVNPDWVDPASLGARRTVEVDAREPFAANALRLPGTLLHDATHGRTRERLERAGEHVTTVELDELGKAEGGPTCLSVLIPRSP